MGYRAQAVRSVAVAGRPPGRVCDNQFPGVSHGLRASVGCNVSVLHALSLSLRTIDTVSPLIVVT